MLAGFERDYRFDEPKCYDHGDGIYTEHWISGKDKSTITIDWDRKNDH